MSSTGPEIGVGDDLPGPAAIPLGETVLAGDGALAGVGDGAGLDRPVGVDVGVDKGDGEASISRKVTASKYTVAGAAEAGRSIKCTLADRADTGARTGPVVRG